jgi:ArsR family transcriptional regulator
LPHDISWRLFDGDERDLTSGYGTAHLGTATVELPDAIEHVVVLSRVGERNSAEIARVMASYFHARDEFEPVSRQELLDRLRCGSATVLDVRPEDEFKMGHLPSALNIPLAQLEQRLAELPTNREIVAYCRGPWCVLSVSN